MTFSGEEARHDMTDNLAIVPTSTSAEDENNIIMNAEISTPCPTWSPKPINPKPKHGHSERRLDILFLMVFPYLPKVCF